MACLPARKVFLSTEAASKWERHIASVLDTRRPPVALLAVSKEAAGSAWGATSHMLIERDYSLHDFAACPAWLGEGYVILALLHTPVEVAVLSSLDRFPSDTADPRAFYAEAKDYVSALLWEVGIVGAWEIHQLEFVNVADAHASHARSVLRADPVGRLFITPVESTE